jgi:hypothetical protein
MDRVQPFIQATHQAKTDQTYDANDNLLSYNCRSGGLTSKIVGTVTYTYDANGNVTSALFTPVT